MGNIQFRNNKILFTDNNTIAMSDECECLCHCDEYSVGDRYYYADSFDTLSTSWVQENWDQTEWYVDDGVLIKPYAYDYYGAGGRISRSYLIPQEARVSGAVYSWGIDVVELAEHVPGPSGIISLSISQELCLVNLFRTDYQRILMLYYNPYVAGTEVYVQAPDIPARIEARVTCKDVDQEGVGTFCAQCYVNGDLVMTLPDTYWSIFNMGECPGCKRVNIGHSGRTVGVKLDNYEYSVSLP